MEDAAEEERAAQIAAQREDMEDAAEEDRAAQTATQREDVQESEEASERDARTSLQRDTNFTEQYTADVDMTLHTHDTLFGELANIYDRTPQARQAQRPRTVTQDIEAQAAVKGSAGGAGAGGSTQVTSGFSAGDVIRATLQTVMEQRLSQMR